MQKKGKIPAPAVERLPLYFRCLKELKDAGVSIVSSEEMSEKTKVKASQFRKDLSYLGEFGIQGLGYPVDQLLKRIAAMMNLDREHNMVIVGAGNLGTALAKYSGFKKWGFMITKIYDNSQEKIGTEIDHLVVEDVKNMDKDVGFSVGIITVPADKAQSAADLLCNAGVRAILNFAATKLEIPEGVVVRNVDVTHELAILNYYLARSNT